MENVSNATMTNSSHFVILFTLPDPLPIPAAWARIRRQYSLEFVAFVERECCEFPSSTRVPKANFTFFPGGQNLLRIAGKGKVSIDGFFARSLYQQITARPSPYVNETPAYRG